MASTQSANSASAIQQWQRLQSMMQSSQTGSSQKSKDKDQAFDPLSMLLNATAPSAGSGAAPPSSSSASGGTCPPFSPETMGAMIDAQAQANGTSANDASTNGMSRHQQNVFGKLDADGDGSVTKTELETSFGADNKAISDYVMKKLDTDGNGAISQNEFAKGTKRGGHHAHGAKPGNAVDALMSATAGASSQSASNSDGTTTTTITYADGSKVSMTSAPTSTNTDSSTNSDASQSQLKANLLEQLIRMQAQLIGSVGSSATSTSTTSVSV